MIPGRCRENIRQNDAIKERVVCHMARIGMIGAGSWGIALTVLLHNNGHDITVWSALKDEIDMLDREHEHKDKLPGVKLADDIVFTTALADAVKEKDILVLAVPSSFTRATACSMKECVAEGQIIVNVAKGIEESSLMTLSQVIEDEIPQADVAVLSGPSHAEEVGKCIPTTIVVGAKTRKTAEFIQSVFMSDVFRVYTSPDVLGIELGRHRGRTRLRRQHKGGAHHARHHGDRKAWHGDGRQVRDILRAVRHRRSDRDLREHAQPQPACRDPHRTGQDDGGGDGGGQEGGRGRVLCKGGDAAGRKISCRTADHRAGERGAVSGQDSGGGS